MAPISSIFCYFLTNISPFLLNFLSLFRTHIPHLSLSLSHAYSPSLILSVSLQFQTVWYRSLCECHGRLSKHWFTYTSLILIQHSNSNSHSRALNILSYFIAQTHFTKRKESHTQYLHQIQKFLCRVSHSHTLTTIADICLCSYIEFLCIWACLFNFFYFYVILLTSFKRSVGNAVFNTSFILTWSTTVFVGRI